MPLWLIILLASYFIGFLVFSIALINEAPKHGAKVGAWHLLVALIWPFWALWYLCSLAKEKLFGE